MIFRLIESYLVEDIAAVKKQYSHVPEEDFDRIIRLDPTFDENRDSVGKYGKWLLGLYKKDNPLNSDIDISKMLSLYDTTVKDRTKKIEKDTGKFRSLSDMETAIENAGEAELSDRQKLRQRQANKDYDLVFENDDWAIFVPNTWEADVNLGKGTSWCTADSREEFGKKYYDNYLSHGGKYYVIMNKHDKSEKYQFHFETEQFMDADDEGIDVGEFCNENGLSEFFEKEGYNVGDYSISKDEILSDIDNNYDLSVEDLRALSLIYQEDVFDLLFLYDFINQNNTSIEDIFDNEADYIEILKEVAEKQSITISDEMNEDYAYYALVNTINDEVVHNFYLRDIVPEKPISGLPLRVNCDDIAIAVDDYLISEWLDDIPSSDWSLSILGEIARIYQGIEIEGDISDNTAILLDVGAWGPVYSNIDMRDVLVTLIENCLEDYYDTFCNEYIGQMIDHDADARGKEYDDLKKYVHSIFDSLT